MVKKTVVYIFIHSIENPGYNGKKKREREGGGEGRNGALG